MARRYENPPLHEAICEFRFEPDSSWDLAVPGLVSAKLADILPTRRQTTSFETSTQPVSNGLEQQVTQVNWLQLWQEDDKAVVQVSPNLLSVNRLAPYPGWEEFLPLVKRSLNEYKEIAEPSGIQQITVRYINRINFENPIQLEEFFDFYPFVGKRLPQELGSFIVGMQTAYENGRDVLQMQMRSTVSDDSGALSILLDLVYFSGQPGVVKFENVFEWIKCAHDRIEDAFEGCLKDPLRERFGEVKE